jgi:hypothetical protein
LHELKVCRLNGYRAGHQTRRLGQIAVRGLDDPEGMQRVGFSRIPFYDFAIKLRGFGAAKMPIAGFGLRRAST